MRGVSTIIFAAEWRRDLCYASENAYYLEKHSFILMESVTEMLIGEQISKSASNQ